MISAYLLSQILIGVALAFDLVSFQFKQRQYTLICFTCAASLIAAHFFLLQATTAGLVVGLSAVRFITAIFTHDKRVMYAFLFMTLIVGIFTYDGGEDTIVTVSMLLSTVASFSADQKRLRYYMMVATVLMIAHNIIIFTPAGIALESFFLASNLISYWRFYWKRPTSSG